MQILSSRVAYIAGFLYFNREDDIMKKSTKKKYRNTNNSNNDNEIIDVTVPQWLSSIIHETCS